LKKETIFEEKGKRVSDYATNPRLGNSKTHKFEETEQAIEKRVMLC